MNNPFFLWTIIFCFLFRQTNTVIVVVFVAPDLNVVISDVIPLDPGHSGVVGVSIPYICCTKKVRI